MSCVITRFAGRITSTVDGMGASSNKMYHVLVFMVGLMAVMGFEDMTITEYLAKHDNYTILTSMLHNTSISGLLSGHGPYTVFAPTDDAFRRMDQSALARINSNHGQLELFLKYHIVKEFLFLSLVKGYSPHKTLQGSDLILHEITGGVLINNGTHVTTPSDVVCNNGVVQTIDSVLSPPVHRDPHNIAQHLIEEERFRDFSLVLLLTDLLAPLESSEFTVFAPINTGFAGLSRVFTDPNMPRATVAEATEIYRYHIVPGKRTEQMLINAGKAGAAPIFTLHGTPLILNETSSGEIHVNYATVIPPAIDCTNGVIYPVNYMLAPRDIILQMLTEAGIPTNTTTRG